MFSNFSQLDQMIIRIEFLHCHRQYPDNSQQPLNLGINSKINSKTTIRPCSDDDEHPSSFVPQNIMKCPLNLRLYNFIRFQNNSAL